jgi:hypothetical protein
MPRRVLFVTQQLIAVRRSLICGLRGFLKECRDLDTPVDKCRASKARELIALAGMDIGEKLRECHQGMALSPGLGTG